MTTKLPFFPWYPTETEADGDWVLMSLAERGLFMTLLNFSWINEGLPNDVEFMARIARVTASEFTPLWERSVTHKFTPVGDLLVNARQEKERGRVIAKSQKCSENAAKREDQKAPGFIYLIRRSKDGAIKIGSSRNPNKRFAQIRHKINDWSSEMIAKYEVQSMGESELKLHATYKEQRITGEWFILTDENVKEIAILMGESESPTGVTDGVNECHPSTRASKSKSSSKEETLNRNLVVMAASIGQSVKPVPSWKDLIKSAADTEAALIHEQHPSVRRDIGVAGISSHLIDIVKHKKLYTEAKTDEAIAYMRRVRERHGRLCASEQWTEQRGKYAKSLDNWLAPTMNRYEQDAPAQGGQMPFVPLPPPKSPAEEFLR